jgi:selenocysteine lyase/cysteine desulfurase
VIEKVCASDLTGSYGSPPLCVLEAKEKMSRKMDSAIDIFIRRKLEPMLVEVRKQLAPIINAELDELVLVPNATHGVNTVAMNIDWKDGDVIVVCESLHLGTTY